MCEDPVMKYYTDRLTPHEDGDLISGVSQAVFDLTDEGGIYCVIHLLHGKPVFPHLHRFRHQPGQTEEQHSDNISITFQIELKLKRLHDC